MTNWLVAAAIGLCLAAPAVCAGVREQGPKDAGPSGLLAGVARADITQPAGIAHLNWGSQTHVEASGIDPAGMYATALVLSDGKQKFAMVDIDRLGVSGLDTAIQRASGLTGIPAAHIRLGATHTHAGPAYQEEKGPVGKDPAKHLPVIEAYERALIDKIAGVVFEANSRLRPVHAYGKKGTGTININRRMPAQGNWPPAVGSNPAGFTDRDLVVIRLDDSNGNPYAVLVNYQCHGIVLTYDNKLISPDWVGMVRKVVENALPGALSLYFQGAAGDQGPVEWGTGDVSVAHRLGSILGHQAAALAIEVETVKRTPRLEGYIESTAYAANERWRVEGPREATLRFASRIVEVPRRRYSPEEIGRMERQVAEARQRVEKEKLSGDAWRMYQAEARLRRFANLLEQWKRPYDTTPLAVEVQALRIGEMALLAMPGEPFARIGADIRKASPFPVTMFCGYSSGRGGDYIPMESDYPHGGYEVERTPYGIGAAEKLIRDSIDLLGKLR